MTDTIMHKIHVWIKEKDVHDVDTWEGEVYICPNCKYKSIRMGVNYCSSCGVRIKWDLKYPNKTITSKPKKDKINENKE